MLSVLSFVLGSSNTLIGPNLLRKFVGYILNISMALIIVDQVHNRYILKRIIRIILLSGFAAAILGIGLYFSPRNLSELILNYLSVFNYPSGNVLRYIEDNPANPLRAIGTSVDPNIFGGLLAIVAALLVPQITSSKPIFKQKFASMLMLVVIITSLLLTYSRTAMSALLASMIFVAVIKNRKVLWIISAMIILILL